MELNRICKAARLEGAALDGAELALVNAQALRPLEAGEVFVFRLAACDSRIDREFERFTPQCLEELARLYVGRPVLRDHAWSAGAQTARVYAAGVEGDGEDRRLVLRCYMPRTPQTAGDIAAIESGILRECSVGVAVRRVLCSVCGADQTVACCPHQPGKTYEGQTCIMELDGAADAYEVSLVAVPAQPGAGVLKSKRYGGAEPQDWRDWKTRAALDLERARCLYDS